MAGLIIPWFSNRIMFSLVFVLLFIYSNAQQAKKEVPEEIRKFLDTLEMGGSYLIGRQMEQFEAKGNNNVKYSSLSLDGKITVVNFWFEHCAPCIAEMDELNSLYNKYIEKQKFQFLSFTFEKKEAVDRLVKMFGIKYPVISISESECQRLNFKKGFPGLMILDEAGIILRYDLGGSTKSDMVKAQFINNVYPVLDKKLN